MLAPLHKTNLFNYSPDRLGEWFAEQGQQRFRSQQLLKWIYHQQVVNFQEMTNLGKTLRDELNNKASLDLPVITDEQRSTDGTVKWLFDVGRSNAVETVFIPEANRGTLCVSSQVGCALNCSFCATGAQGFNRNLSTAEIIGQVWQAANRLGHQRNGKRCITNIVMMGMGEPLLNIENVFPALELMRDDFGFGFANRRVTVSTAGVIPGIDALSEAVDVALAVSLHAPIDDVRDVLVPLNRKYPIADLMAACQRFISDKNKRTVTFEYTLINGVNDQPEMARRLVKLLRRLPSKLNLIPFNPFPGTHYQCSSDERINAFQSIVKKGGIVATVRRTRGDDIAAACGQLAGDFTDRTRRSQRLKQAALQVVGI